MLKGEKLIREILRLSICPSNNDSYIIISFCVNCILNPVCVPRTIRSDRGSENVVVAGIQQAVRGEHQVSIAGHSSFLFGISTNNQRIEPWW